MMKKDLSVLILAAGKGKRMKSSKPKVLFEIANKPMVLHVIDKCINLGIKDITIVLNKESDEVKKIIPKELKVVYQEKQLGTANAILSAEKYLKKINKNLLVLYADVPLISENTIFKLINKTKYEYPHICIFETNKPQGYGRVSIENKSIKKIVEEQNASAEEKKITLCNSGIFCANSKMLFNALKKVKKNIKSKEYLLTDIFSNYYEKKIPFRYLLVEEEEVLGVNDRKQLASVEHIFQNKIREKIMENGVTLVHPETIFFSHDTSIAKDVKIGPNNYFGTGVIIKSNVVISNNCSIEETKIGNKSLLGPFCRLRGGNKIGNNVKIGNFVEIKKSTIENNVKLNHLTYVGDAKIGKNTNIGAGTITCNYDGKSKNNTVIGDNVFIGSNCSLVAPITIKKGSFIAAGSTITKNLEENDFGIGRAKQKTFKGRSKKYLKKIN